MAVVSEAMAKGARHGWVTVCGIIVGDFIYLSFAMFGLGTVAQAMGEAFFIIKIIAGIYLVCLGIKLWCSTGKLSFESRRADPRGSLIAGLLITLANPKAIMFYCVFLPNFIDLARFSLNDYLLVIVLDVSVMGIYIYLSLATGRLAGKFSGRFLRRTAGVIMVGTGTRVALD